MKERVNKAEGAPLKFVVVSLKMVSLKVVRMRVSDTGLVSPSPFNFSSVDETAVIIVGQ